MSNGESRGVTQAVRGWIRKWIYDSRYPEGCRWYIQRPCRRVMEEDTIGCCALVEKGIRKSRKREIKDNKEE